MDNLKEYLTVVYRISDGPTPGKFCSREACYANFLETFGGLPTVVVADNCGQATLSMVKSQRSPNMKIVETSLGNSKSFRLSLKYAIEATTHFVYFCEDDYLHRPESPYLLIEGLRWSNYVTLYDHPDKYVDKRGYGEIGRCIKTETSHWRQTISTCCTFGANTKILQEDAAVMTEFAAEGTKVPNDHGMWCTLAQKKRSLIVAIPGAAFNTHRTAEHSNFDWGASWATPYIKAAADISRPEAFSPFQQVDESLKFQPVDLKAPAPKMPVAAPNVPAPATFGLPDISQFKEKAGSTTTLPAAPALTASIGNEVKIRKKNPGLRPPLAIPDVGAYHQQQLLKKPDDVVKGQFGVFLSSQ